MDLPQILRRKLNHLAHPALGRILMLHRVVESRSEGENRQLEITPTFLEESILSYLHKGYTFISIDEAVQTLCRNQGRTPFVCLTFDDGYADTYTRAFPLLHRLRIPFAVYISSAFVDNGEKMWWYAESNLCLSTEQLRSLDRSPLCTLCAHTTSHPRLTELPAEECREEIHGGKKRLEEMIGHEVHHFSYPHGLYNAEALGAVREAGFRSAVLACGGVVRHGADPLLLPRIELRQP